MGFREFKDADGRTWRAWDIKPEAIHPKTRAEDYLADCYVVGWIVFLDSDDLEKRRLCPYPGDWATASVDKLRGLLANAEVVSLGRPADVEVAEVPAAAVASVQANVGTVDLADLRVVRSFRYPGGRFWTVCVVEHPEDGSPPALRFQSGMRWIDLRPWPEDWADAPDEKLVEMLWTAAPRAPTPVTDDTPRRRHGDQPRP